MAAVTRSTNARPSMPAGYEDVHDVKLAGAALDKGDLVYLDGTNGWKLATSTEAIAGKQLGFSAQDYAVGRADCSILVRGEIGNYGSGLTPGAGLWPGGVAGDLVDAAPAFYSAATTPAVAVPLPPHIWATSATGIRFSF